MRELMGKIPTKDPNISEEVYLSEIVRCCECQRTVPMGIEVLTVKKGEECKEVLRHEYYCRAHGIDYETRVQSLPIRPHARPGDSRTKACNTVGSAAKFRDWCA
jgi:hypothetical protein